MSLIAKRNHTTYTRLYDANKQIHDPNLIYPGESIRIPGAKEHLTDRLTSSTGVTHTTTASDQTISQASYHQTNASAPAATPRAAPSNVWYEIAACESGGNWSINTGNGYYGGLQFTLSSWQAVGGNGYPNQASPAEQIARAQILLSREGWGAWPACAASLGLI